MLPFHLLKVNKNVPNSAGWNSYFEHPSEFRSTLFPSGAFNKPLEPAAVSRVNAAVVSAADRRLAANLAVLDQASDSSGYSVTFMTIRPAQWAWPLTSQCGLRLQQQARVIVYFTH